MVSSMESLPLELLAMILVTVKSSAGVSDLLCCLRVCKRWHDVGISKLYRHVVLDCRSITRFRETFNLREAVRVRSLTVRATRLPRDGVYRIDEDLILFTDVLTKLDNLSTFSFCTPPPVRFDVYRIWQALFSLIDALPHSCVNLELDLMAYHRHFPRTRRANFVHICDKLRCLLPRMHHVHLKLPVICPDVLSSLSTNSDNSPTPIKLPNLQTLFIHCKYASRMIITCGLGSATSWMSMTSILQKLADRPEACPPSASLFALGGTRYTRGSTLRDAFILAELRSRTSRAFPIVVLNSGGWLMRMGDGKGVVSSSGEHITKVVEEVAWKTLVGGARLPSVIAENEDEPTQGLLPPLYEESYWRAMNPEKTCQTWENESLTGTIMLDAEVRQDPATYLDLNHIVEKTIGTA
ncbi:uncharacterized protein F4817DRAFT_325435 [Daldinia loculata]|uniref:uncharacterized protein n=1 Tax=Daldinia loculata TaxID=103429 RepID=UPI0020C377E2|nr:uncharacterized protein F4817DRAFT_325435 [Daldinia loculata]KAI1651203.1 hypothetical protein F4817DRAFT_325435 [Daldinia loculata]